MQRETVEGLKLGRAVGQEARDEKAVEDLLDICEDYRPTREVIDAHGASRDDLRELLTYMRSRSFGIWVGGDYLPVSALTERFTLDYLLTNRPPWTTNEQYEILRALVHYFQDGQTGPVNSDPSIYR